MLTLVLTNAVFRVSEFRFPVLTCYISHEYFLFFYFYGYCTTLWYKVYWLLWLISWNHVSSALYNLCVQFWTEAEGHVWWRQQRRYKFAPYLKDYLLVYVDTLDNPHEVSVLISYLLYGLDLNDTYNGYFTVNPVCRQFSITDNKPLKWMLSVAFQYLW